MNCSCPSPDGRRAQADDLIAKPHWPEFADVYLFWPVVGWLAVRIGLMPLCQYLYAITYYKKGTFSKFVHAFIGTETRPQVLYPAPLLVLEISQFVFSAVFVVKFANRTYSREIDDTGEWTMSLLFFVHYIVRALQMGFNPFGVWHFVGLLDFITVVPVFCHYRMDLTLASKDSLWLSLGFLRAFFVLRAYDKVSMIMDIYSEIPMFYCALIGSLLRTLGYVICMGGVILVLEVLGEIPGYEDTFIPTEMGDLSFCQMFYWVFTTISTVGYGDYSPTTLPSRMCIVVFITFGVFFFSHECSKLLEVNDSLTRGEGKYFPHKRGDVHIVVTSAAFFAGSATIPLMDDFLRECLDREEGTKVPNVVLLSETPYDNRLVKFVRNSLPPWLRKRVFLFVGSAVNRRDLARVRLDAAMLAFILPDLLAPDPHSEDNQNIFRAVEMRRINPKLRLRVMLLESDSPARAEKLGISREKCFAVQEWKAKIFAQSCRIKGFIPLIGTLIQNIGAFNPLSLESSMDPTEWDQMEEYFGSLQACVLAFIASDALDGVRFGSAAAQLYEDTDGDLLLVGAQVEGRLLLNIDACIGAGDVLFAITKDPKKVRHVADTSVDWRTVFLERHGQTFHTPATADSGLVLSRALRSTVSLESEVTKLVGNQLITNVQHSFSPRLSAFGNECPTSREPAKGGAATCLREQLSEFRANPGLVLLIVTGDTSSSVWLQIATFLRTLRQPFLPGKQPVVVVTNSAPPAQMKDFFTMSQTTFLSGEHLSDSFLVDIGVRDAQTVVVLRGDEGEDRRTHAGTVLADHEVLMLVSTVENLVASHHKEHFTLFEFTCSHSMHLMEQALYEVHRVKGVTIGGFHTSRTMLPSFGASGPMLSNSLPRILAPIAHMVKSVCNGSGDKEDIVADALGNEALLHRRFAAGQAFSVDMFGVLCGRMFHFPAVIELIEAMAMPMYTAQKSFCWQIAAPEEWLGFTMGQITSTWAAGKDPSLEGLGSVLVLAVYRKSARRGALVHLCKADSPGVNVTLPDRSLILAQGDLITVIAGESFGKNMAEKQLLRGHDFRTTVSPTSACSSGSKNLKVTKTANSLVPMAGFMEDVGSCEPEKFSSSEGTPASAAQRKTASDSEKKLEDRQLQNLGECFLEKAGMATGTASPSEVNDKVPDEIPILWSDGSWPRRFTGASSCVCERLLPGQHAQ